MGKWRYSGNLYSDVVRREFSEERPLTIKQRHEIYRVDVRKRLECYVQSVVTPVYPTETKQLIRAAVSALADLKPAPLTYELKHRLAWQILYKWRKALPSLSYGQERVFLTGLCGYVCEARRTEYEEPLEELSP